METQKISFYFDEMMRRAVAKALQEREIDVVMAIDVGMTGKSDPEHLQFATERGSVMVTRDKPFAGQVSTQTEPDHAGLICWTGADDDIGGMIRKLTQFVERHTVEEVMGRVFWLKE